jgi:Fe2+ or Zn2+ uptake regulation protein
MKKQERLHRSPDPNRQLLKKIGIKATNRRALILEVIRSSKRHLDADEIYRRAKTQEPRLSLSTVYRTLQKLKEQGVINELHLSENHHHYEINLELEHQHLICINCGQVIEVDFPLAKTLERISRSTGFKIDDVEVNLSGYCSKCNTDPNR